MASWLLQYWLQCGYPSKEPEVQKQISNADRFVHLNCIIFRRSVRIMKIRHGYKYHFTLVLLPQSMLCTDLLRQIFSQVKSPKGWQANMLSEPAGTSIKTTSDLNWHFPNTAVWNNIKNEIYSALMLWFCYLRLFCQCLPLRSSPICLHIQLHLLSFLFFLPCVSDFEWVAAVFWDTWPVMSLEKLQHCFAEWRMFWLPLPFITVVQFHGY